MSFADKARKILKEMKDTNCEKSELKPLPYFDLDGSLIISFAADPRFHWWKGGQSVKETIEEVRAWKH